MDFRIALAQMDPVLGDLAGNVERHVALAERARAAGADLVVFPELSLTGYSIRDMNWELALHPGRDDDRVRPLLEASRSIAILAGGVEESEQFGIYNAAFLCEGGRMVSVHRKTYPPTYGMFEEMRYFSRGTSVKAFDTKYGRLGVLICEDLWHISLPYLLALDGAQCIIGLVASPTRVSGDKVRLGAAEVNAENERVHARLLSTYLAVCNRVGFEDGVNFWGGSLVVGPAGDIVVEAKLFEEDLVVARIHDEEVRRARRFSRHFLDEDPTLVLRELERITAASK
jgi:NAD+ synthase (glutamine-hydrolysing)